MTFTEAAVEVLRLAGKPLHYKEITELAVEKNLLSHVGKSPEVTMGARLAALLKKDEEGNPIVRIRPGVFGLRDWKGKNPGPGAAAPDEDSEDGGVNALELEAHAALAKAPTSASEEADDDDAAPTLELPNTPAAASPRLLRRPAARATITEREPAPVLSQDEALRADLAASGADLFDDEDDDDQPIFGSSTDEPATDGALGADGDAQRRKRRRRRRGRGRADEATASSPRLEGTGVEGAATDERPREERPRDERPRDERPRDDRPRDDRPRDDRPRDDRPRSEREPRDDRPRSDREPRPNYAQLEANETNEEVVSGKELADSVLLALAGLDRSQGPVGVRGIAEQLSRRGKASSDPILAAAQVAACVRADNLRRAAVGQRPRFRFASQGRIALTDWSLSQDVLKLEQEALIAVERYRDASRKMLLRRLQELPGHAFIELALLALERIGMTQLRSVRRAGSPGGEAHFAGVHKTGTDDIRTALVIRKDGREIGRERVSDLRGALHHYGPAQAGWLVTTGQVLSGARDEAGTPNASPVALYDGLSFARMLEDHSVAVLRTQVTVAIPDLDLLEALRGA